MNQREEDCVRLNKCEEPLTVRSCPSGRERGVACTCRGVCNDVCAIESEHESEAPAREGARQCSLNERNEWRDEARHVACALCFRAAN